MNAGRLPWWLKIGAKIILSRLPVPYDRWRRIGGFKHGAMLDPDYAIRVFDKHYESVCSYLPLPFSVMELGPGDALATAVIAASRGASATYLVDVGAFAKTDDVTQYNVLAMHLASNGAVVPGAPFASVPEMLRFTRVLYLAEGVKSLQSIPAASVDLIFSQAVLEHVRRQDFVAMMVECQRILKPGGVASHRVDLRDHLAGRLNHLRFSRRTWESRLFAESGFYVNRIQYRAMLGLFSEAGFDVVKTEVERWSELPTPRARLADEFRNLPDDDLNVSGFTVILKSRAH